MNENSCVQSVYFRQIHILTRVFFIQEAEITTGGDEIITITDDMNSSKFAAVFLLYPKIKPSIWLSNSVIRVFQYRYI